MLPTGTVHIDTLLSGILIGRRNSSYIADDVLPPIFTGKLTGKVAKMGDDHYRVDFAARALGTPGNIVGWSVSSTSYSLDEYRLEHPIDDSELPQYDDPFDAKRDAQFVLGEKLQLKKEIDIASLVMTSGNYASGHTDTSNRSWNVPATGLPVDDVQVGIGVIQDKTGVSEDRIYGACSAAVFRMLRKNNQIKTVFLNTNPGAAAVGALSKAQVATCLGLAGLFVGSAVQITSKEGATVTRASVWGGDDFSIFYKSENPGIMTPNFGYGVYPRIPNLPGAQVVSDTYRREDLTSDMVRSRLLLDSIVADNEMGYLFTSVDDA